MWCSEQAVGEDVIALLIAAGVQWTISDETVLARSLTGAWVPRVGEAESGLLARSAAGPPPPATHFTPYRLTRETGEIAIVFRDHTLSDLIGFAYQSWPSRDAAMDLLRRLRDVRASTPMPARTLVTIALDGENAWEYYPRDGRDFLQYLYEGLSSDPALRCVTVSEHLRESPPSHSLGWLHTGSWIGGDLRTWSGDRAHNIAWDLLHQARDIAAAHRRASSEQPLQPKCAPVSESPADVAWRHVLVAEGSDWFWWFGDHHRTELDHVWDVDFRTRLQEVYRVLGQDVPTDLFLPIIEQAPAARPAPPRGPVSASIDGLLGDPAEWSNAGRLAADIPSTMQRSEETRIEEVRFGWHDRRLCLLVVPGAPAQLEGLEVELRFSRPGTEDEPVLLLTLEHGGRVGVSWKNQTGCAEIVGRETAEARWDEVLEVMLPSGVPEASTAAMTGLVVRIGRQGMTEHVFHSAGLVSIGWEEQ